MARRKIMSRLGAHDAEWREPAQIASHWKDAVDTDPALFKSVVRGAWWETLAATRSTLLVAREYEHLLIAIRAGRRRPEATFLRMPHPSGLAVDRARARVYVASTRNPNQIFELAPVDGLLPRRDRQMNALKGRPLVPVRSWFYPGSLYLHELAILGGQLHANAVGRNTVVRLDEDGSFHDVWWPRSVEKNRRPLVDRNVLQLNSIAAGRDLHSSFFCASAERPSSLFPGDPKFPVDRRGVIFSGRTREPIARGLTRPHSTRLVDGRLWVDNSGYGDLGIIDDAAFWPIVRLPGWTRGLCVIGNIAFVGTSRVLPRFRSYAPGLDVSRSVCGIHAVEIRSGRILGSLIWPRGDQIFAIECAPAGLTTGFPFPVPGGASERQKSLFYGFKTALTKDAR
jgi:uncharacterized protein (TIGR03032 family)